MVTLIYKHEPFGDLVNVIEGVTYVSHKGICKMVPKKMEKDFHTKLTKLLIINAKNENDLYNPLRVTNFLRWFVSEGIV